MKSLINNYLTIIKEIEEKSSTKDFYLNKLYSFILSLFFVLPFVAITINLMIIYYSLFIAGIFILIALAIILVFLYTKFNLDIILKKYEIENKGYVKNIYYINLFLIFIFIIVLIIILCIGGII